MILFLCNYSSLSEKICLQEDDQLKAFRPARLMRGLLQRPKPNVGKAAERKETVTSQEKIGASVEKNENESCIDRDVSTLMPSSFLLNKYISLLSSPVLNSNTVYDYVYCSLNLMPKSHSQQLC